MNEIFAWLNQNQNHAVVTAISTSAGVLVTLIYTFVTALLALVARKQTKIIATQQKLQEMQVKYMLYDRRLKVFGAVLDFIATINTTTRLELTSLGTFNSNTAESKYIFPKDIQNYIKELNQNAANLHVCRTRYDNRFKNLSDTDKDRVECEKEINYLYAWFITQDDEAIERFSPYLTIEENIE